MQWNRGMEKHRTCLHVKHPAADCVVERSDCRELHDDHRHGQPGLGLGLGQDLFGGQALCVAVCVGSTKPCSRKQEGEALVRDEVEEGEVMQQSPG